LSTCSRTTKEIEVFFRQKLCDDTACASYLFGCPTYGQFAVVDPHVDLVDDYIGIAEAHGVPIVAVLETHLQADHVSGLPALVQRTGATAYLPAGSGVEFEHSPLADGEVLVLGNTEIQAVATPGHALAHHAYLVTDRRRAHEPWLVLTGDALLVGDAGRPDLHAHGDDGVEDLARTLYRSLTERLLTLPDHLALYPRTTQAPSADAGCRATRARRSASNVATTTRCSSSPRTRSSPRCWRTSRPLPWIRLRSSPPTAPAGRS
jgi:hydroxyacylglutathione hydrolase